MASTQQILGIRFFDGSVREAVEEMSARGGYLVAPSATCFARLRRDGAYRRAMTAADMAIPDSGAMVFLWRLLRRRKITRISGLRYLQNLVEKFKGIPRGQILWILPNDQAREKTLAWSLTKNLSVTADDCYVAPIYAREVADTALVARLDRQRPQHIVIGIGSGPQEKLGHYLRERLSYRPAIHCIGAALGFLTGDQIAIPDWADLLYLGWLLRLFAQPRIFIPRLTRALQLPLLIFRNGENLPPLKQSRR